MQCTYCRVREAETRDHVPPDCLFPVPRPDNLITVPACRICNERFGRDDEYFHQCLMTAENLETVPTTEEPRERARRGLARPQAQGLLRKIVLSFQDVEVYSPGGIYLGTQPALRVDRQRILGVIERIARGLYFAVNQIAVPEEYGIKCYWDQYSFPKPIREVASQIGVQWPGPFYIGEGVFSFTYLQQPFERGPQGLWLMSFYERFCMGAYVRERPSVPPSPNSSPIE